ncbi:COG1470 family protein [Acaryochloris marina]|uniref:Uncharacterized protein n=1 Tax=Acaryochloris marina (strain MBIC 11017) TaxID=329726 RepID=B0C8R8_ACAM1|nr:hypothetical protein [Acaryochloris marina]ABW31330.1 hypothetical protein AM1_6400 [Acaryochloris marina MBIC11017]BDM80004.1 hypothetical protein AM10699_28720 [Acaryochloris marina MBIC10699]
MTDLTQIDQIGLQAQKVGNPLGIIRNPSGDVAIQAGEIFELSVTVTNDGIHSAIIHIDITDPTDIVSQWCTSSRESLALNPGESSEVFFRIQVPTETLPGFYPYTLVIDAPKHYPEETPIRYPARLQVLSYIRETAEVSNPVLGITPTTTAESPLPLQTGDALALTVLVDNRCDRVDRFRLICPDLPTEWVKIIYPEGPQTGVVIASEALELNPGDTGQIQVLIQPPLGTDAGIYTPTIRLFSMNNPELVLLEAVYLQVLPIYQVDIELISLVSQVKNQSGWFELRLHNAGNTPRTLNLQVQNLDAEELCDYTLNPTQVHLLPHASTKVSLEVQPTKWWKRPFYGRPLNFALELEDAQQLPLANNRFQGALIWEPRPWWQLLLVILTLFGTLVGIALLVWWLLTRPPARAEIISFAPATYTLKEADGRPIELNWTIKNPQKFKQLQLKGVSPDGVVMSGPFIYDFQKGIPSDLSHFCTLTEVLRCQQVPTDARKPGTYRFELSLSPQPEGVPQPIAAKTEAIVVQPFPPPQIQQFESTKTTYTEPIGQVPPRGPSGIFLNWKITQAKGTKVTLIGRGADNAPVTAPKIFDFTQGIPQSLQKNCRLDVQTLVCLNVPTGVQDAGTYTFELKVAPKPTQANPPAEPSPIIQKTEPIQIQPGPVQIQEFKINGQIAKPKYVFALKDQTPLIVKVSWKVKGSKNTKVNLLPAPGTVPLQGKANLSFGPTSATQTLTLQVTNAKGEQQNRSVVIETVAPPAPVAQASDAPVSAEANNSTPPAAAPGVDPNAAAAPAPPLPDPPGGIQPVPRDRNSPPPAELPPQF